MSDEDLDIPRNERTALSRTPKRRRLLPVVLLVLLLIAGGLVGWQYFAAFTQQSAQQEIPIVRAEPGPVKVRPEEPGGMRIPNQDKLVYGRLGETGEPRVERLMPPAEQPMAPPQPAPAPASETGSGETSTSVPVGPMTEPAPGAQPRRETPPASSSGQAAARMTLPTDTAARRQEMAQAETVPPPPPPPPAEAPASSRPVAPRVQPEPAPAPAPATEAPSPAPAPVPDPAPRQQAAPVSSGDWMLQLGALRSEAAARTEWSRLQKSHEDLLGGMTLDIQRAEVPEKGTFYRIRIGPVADREAGTALCGKLALRKIGCFVVKR